MGVTIHHRFGIQKHRIKTTLDKVEAMANRIANDVAPKINLKMEVRRLADETLLVDVGNCETLDFDFKSVKQIDNDKEREGWDYTHATINDTFVLDRQVDPNYKEYELWYSSSFCKTQYSNPVSHKIVADLTKYLAGFCHRVSVIDEGEYYHTGNLEDLVDAVAENKKILDDLATQLKNNGYPLG